MNMLLEKKRYQIMNNDYMDTTQCCSAQAYAKAVEHNRKIDQKRKEERIDEINKGVEPLLQEIEKLKQEVYHKNNTIKERESVVKVYTKISEEAEEVLSDIIKYEGQSDYWDQRFESITKKEDAILRGSFGELEQEGLIKIFWSSGIPYHIEILKDGYLYDKHIRRNTFMSEFEKEMYELLERSKQIKSPIGQAMNGTNIREYNYPSTVWMNDFEIFADKYLKEHPLNSRIGTLLFHRKASDYTELVACLESISKDQDFIDKVNGMTKVSVPKYQADTLPEYDVFISHANKDKEELIEELYQSLNKMGIKIFYDKESLEWGDNWKQRILDGTQKAEFAIIVISENFFDREWTEKELREFLNRQNRNGQKLILPILHNISVKQLQEKYPSIADIQAINSQEHSCDEIALMFARQLIKRLKNV